MHEENQEEEDDDGEVGVFWPQILELFGALFLIISCGTTASNWIACLGSWRCRKSAEIIGIGIKRATGKEWNQVVNAK